MTGRLTGSNAARRAINFSKVLLSAAPLCAIVTTPPLRNFRRQTSRKKESGSPKNRRVRAKLRENFRGMWRILGECVGDIITRLFHLPTRNAVASADASCAKARDGVDLASDLN